MKKSDAKQWEGAMIHFDDVMDEFMDACQLIKTWDKEDFTTDNLNQISSRIEKATKTIKKIGESFNKKITEEDWEDEYYGGVQRQRNRVGKW